MYYTFVHVVIGTGPHVHNLLFLVLLQFHHKGEWPARTLGHYAMKHSVVIAVIVIDYSYVCSSTHLGTLDSLLTVNNTCHMTTT